jgi:L-lactate dehydrogenase complex protein LldE
MDEPAVSARMGRDRLHDYLSHGARAVVSTDVSCMMHLDGVARRERAGLPLYHVAEVLAGTAGAR